MHKREEVEGVHKKLKNHLINIPMRLALNLSIRLMGVFALRPYVRREPPLPDYSSCMKELADTFTDFVKNIL